MRRRKKPVKVWKIIILVLVLIVGINAGGNYLISEGNYEINTQVESTFGNSNFTSQGYLNSTSTLANFKYSLNNKVDNYSIIVATYNVLNYLRLQGSYTEPFKIADIMKYYDLYAELGFGYFGINPLAVTWYLKSLGLNAEISFARENIKNRIETSTVCVLFSTNFKGESKFRAMRYYSATEVFMYGPNGYGSMDSLLYGTYKDYFVALISINMI